MAPGSKKGVDGSDPMATLTDDILADIISRVPYKSTCCCKCVSKRWRDLISHRDHRKKMPQSIVGFFYQDLALLGYCCTFVDASSSSPSVRYSSAGIFPFSLLGEYTGGHG
ncbi:uncharacterized protein LOC125545881 isoform X3 [Triticum urartu]|uniref:uncharacterized protein LOC125545881 isoform X3 n=1 Tax=Triticum urartu TaxID=4572 RepID=UPI0020437EF6|nr:uncharacterized protein LOC125545881 isoform X3 [Triticum urartu]